MSHNLRILLIAIGLFLSIIGIIVLSALELTEGAGFGAVVGITSLLLPALVDATVSRSRSKKTPAPDLDVRHPPNGAHDDDRTPAVVRDEEGPPTRRRSRMR